VDKEVGQESKKIKKTLLTDTKKERTQRNIGWKGKVRGRGGGVGGRGGVSKRKKMDVRLP